MIKSNKTAICFCPVTSKASISHLSVHLIPSRFQQPLTLFGKAAQTLKLLAHTGLDPNKLAVLGDTSFGAACFGTWKPSAMDVLDPFVQGGRDDISIVFAPQSWVEELNLQDIGGKKMYTKKLQVCVVCVCRTMMHTQEADFVSPIHAQIQIVGIENPHQELEVHRKLMQAGDGIEEKDED